MINPIIFAQDSDTIWFVGGDFKHQVRHWMRKEVTYREVTSQCYQYNFRQQEPVDGPH